MSTEIVEIENKKDSQVNTPLDNTQDVGADSKKHKGLKNIIPFSKKWRVKLYILNENGQWDDRGIGYVFCANESEEEISLNGVKQNSSQLVKKLIMLKEKSEEVIFNINIKKDNIIFHNQRGTIITWKSGESFSEDNNAISFQEKEGVLEILKNIKIINGKNLSDEEILRDEPTDAFLDVTKDNLPNLVREFGPNMDDQKLSYFIEYLKDTNCEFIKKIGKILEEEGNKFEDIKSNTSFSSLKTNMTLNMKKDCNSENKKDAGNTNDKDIKDMNKKIIFNENINYIFNLFKNLILIGEKDLLELLFDDECYLITFGALEYDIQSNKIVPHRKYFKEIVKFKNPLNIKDEILLQKINQNLRLTYLRDTAFSRLIDDNTSRIINTIIQMNHNDIIQYFIYNKDYLEILFSQLKSEDVLIQKDAILFLSELISCSKNVVQSRITFNETLCENGILPILSNLIENIPDNNNKEKELININAVEIFISILSAVPHLIRQYLIDNEGQMLEQLTKLLLYHTNFGVKYEVSQIFKTLIESHGETYDKKIFLNSTIEEFINFLISPKSDKKNDISSTIQIIIEILMVWFNNLGFDSELWLDKYHINSVIIKLLKDKNKIINIYVIKLLKIILENSEHSICLNIITKELCNLLINLFNENMKKNNIITSCLLNFFNSMSQTDNYILNIFMNYSSDFFYNNKEYFSEIILRYERKPTPKKKLLSYLNTNTIIDTSLKDIEKIGYTNLDNYRENEMDGFFNNNNYINAQDEEDEDDMNLLNKNEDLMYFDNADNRASFLCKKRHFGKSIDEDPEGNSHHYLDCHEDMNLNKRLNNFGKQHYKNLNLNYFSNDNYKHTQYSGMGLGLREIDDDELFKNFDDDDDELI